ncbi:hypothetical protein KP509_19G066400 [Ceratopteris richardii]|uniref:Pentatricopeptide repeat-containing protein n=1 Tax=Ceratopteris richardii TaxID=49495 RepID=A0A8T2SPQ5_CERRI|nr:hypothetical protein KP509_19G066400 [Ceratopteris richardii]
MLFSKDHIYSLLQECVKKQDIVAGRYLHSIIIFNNFIGFNILNDHLVRLFSATQNLFEANLVFCNISDPSVFSWEAIISSYVALRQHDKAFELFYCMRKEGLDPNRCVFLTLLKGSCTSRIRVRRNRLIHDQILRTGFDSDRNVVNTLIDAYAKLGSLEEAQKVFDTLYNPDVVSFGALITGYTLNGRGLLALKLYERLHGEGYKPDKVTYLTILKACGAEAAIEEGRVIHDHVVRQGLQSEILVASTLLDMYGKCGSLEEAQKVFDSLAQPTIVSWSALIAGYAQHGHGEAALKVFENMLGDGKRPDKVTFICTLKACGILKAIEEGRILHDQIIRSGYLDDAALGSTLIDMYGNCGFLNEANRVFSCAIVQDEVMWSAMIVAYTQHGHGDIALEVFQRMVNCNKSPNNATYAVVLKACGMEKGIIQGQLVYDQVIRSTADTDLAVNSAVVDMYCKCGNLHEAFRVFDSIRTQDVILWGSIISGYSQNGFGLQALLLFEKMQSKLIKPSSFIFSSVIKSCTNIQALDEGKLIHHQIVKNNLESDIVIGNALVDMYSTCENLEDAQKVFDGVACLDRISWNALIAGYTRHRQSAAALRLFSEMKQHSIDPDEVTFSSAVKACGSMGATTTGKHIHDMMLRAGIESNVIVGTTLLDMYGTCGKLEEARRVFDRLPNKNSVTWCALVAGYAQHNKLQLALDCIIEMQDQGFQPDKRIHTIMLTACNQLGDIEEGHKYFRSLVEEISYSPSIEHIICMIDLFGRHGQLQEAVELLKAMPSSPDLAGWMSVLTACKKFNNAEVGSRCLDQIAHFDYELPSAFMFMSNIYADANMLKNVSEIQSLKKFANAWKMPGKACIEIGDEVHELVVGDETCMPNTDLAIKIDRLTKLIGLDGYMPNLDSVV